MWQIEKIAGFEVRFKKFSRKHEDEASAALNNLQTYLDVLNETKSLLIANQQPFVHSEPDGMVAIDERGAVAGKTGKKKATRLYVYAAVISEVVYLLGIGDKDSQKQDLVTLRKRARRIGKDLNNG